MKNPMLPFSRASLLLSLASLLLLPPLAVQAQEKLTLEDITTLLEAGSTSDEILAELNKLGYSGPTDQSALAALKKSGASVALILAVKNGTADGAGASPAPAQPSASSSQPMASSSQPAASSSSSSEEASAVWEDCRDFLQSAGRRFAYPFALDYVSPSLLAEVAALREPLNRAKNMQVSSDQSEDWFAKFEQGDIEDFLTDEHAAELKKKIQVHSFEGANAKTLTNLKTSWLNNAYAKMEAAGSVPSGAKQCLILLPEPGSENEKQQRRMIDFMHLAFEKARGLGTEVVFVTTPFGNGSSPSQQLMSEFATEASQGLRLVTDFPGRHSAPWAFLYRHGRVVAEGSLYEWADAPEVALARLTRENVGLADYLLSYEKHYGKSDAPPSDELQLEVVIQRGEVRAGDPIEFIGFDHKTGEKSVRRCLVKNLTFSDLPIDQLGTSSEQFHKRGFVLTVKSSDGRAIDPYELPGGSHRGMEQIAGPPGLLQPCRTLEGRIKWADDMKMPTSARGILVNLKYDVQVHIESSKMIASDLKQKVKFNEYDDMADFSFSADGKAGGSINVAKDTTGPVTVHTFRPVLTEVGATIHLMAINAGATQEILLGTMTVTRAEP